tara:strand:- start:292 stop:576 length:285 start_codon:yes stop_codon:yes gene_type:complete
MSHLNMEKKIMNINIEKLTNTFVEHYKALNIVKDQINSFLDKHNHNYSDGMDAEYFLHLLAQHEEKVFSMIKESNPSFDKDKYQDRIVKETYKA